MLDPRRAVVVGAGTMGRGIAQVLVEAGMWVHLLDPVGDAAESGRRAVAAAWDRAVERGRLAPDTRAEHIARLSAGRDHADGGPAPAWAIEAVYEDVSVKRRVLAELDARFPPETRIATNTSSITVSSLAGALAHPERFGGLHFFNPVPRMALVEIIATPSTGGDWALAAGALVEALGKAPVMAPDRPGFLVNRIMRPFYAEALRLVEEEVADLAVVDRVMEGAGFPMGPFRLMDLVGVDVNLAVTEAVYAQTFGEPRYRPHPRQAEMVNLGWIGRKTGRGFYRYPAEPAAEPAGPPGPAAGVVVRGPEAFQAAWRSAGLAGRLWDEPPEPGLLRYVVDPAPGAEPPAGLGPGTLAVVDGTARHADALARRWERPVVGFDPSLVLAGARVMTVSGACLDDPQLMSAVRALFSPMAVERVADRHGHVFSRIAAMLVDEALRFRPVERPGDVDRAVRLGVNHPRGPFEWLMLLGAGRLAAVLTALTAVGGDRYRPGEDLLRAAEAEAAARAE